MTYKESMEGIKAWVNRALKENVKGKLADSDVPCIPVRKDVAMNIVATVCVTQKCGTCPLCVYPENCQSWSESVLNEQLRKLGLPFVCE